MNCYCFSRATNFRRFGSFFQFFFSFSSPFISFWFGFQFLCSIFFAHSIWWVFSWGRSSAFLHSESGYITAQFWYYSNILLVATICALWSFKYLWFCRFACGIDNGVILPLRRLSLSLRLSLFAMHSSHDLCKNHRNEFNNFCKQSKTILHCYVQLLDDSSKNTCSQHNKSTVLCLLLCYFSIERAECEAWFSPKSTVSSCLHANTFNNTHSRSDALLLTITFSVRFQSFECFHFLHFQ